MLTIVPNEDGEMVAVPVHVEGEEDKMEVHMDNADNEDGQVKTIYLCICSIIIITVRQYLFFKEGQEVQELQLINEDGEIQEGAVTMRDPATNTLYVWSVFPNSK